MSNFINDVSVRRARMAEKQTRILDFLKTEQYTTADNLMHLLGVKTRPAVFKTMEKLARDGLVRKHEWFNGMSYINLYGLTPHGLGMALDDSDDINSLPVFSPAHIAVSTFWHKMDVQKIRLVCQSKGLHWIFIHQNKTQSRKVIRHLPDGVIAHNEKYIGIEVERTIKSPARYRDILGFYLTDETIDFVFYLCPNDKFKRQLGKLFANLTWFYKTVNGKKKRIEVSENNKFKVIKLLTYDEFYNIDFKPS